jgi:hypothetical protein
VEVFGSRHGPSTTVVHFSSSKHDLRHVIGTFPLFNRVRWKPAVQDEEDVGAGFVRFRDELVGVHAVGPRSGEVAVAVLVSFFLIICASVGFLTRCSDRHRRRRFPESRTQPGRPRSCLAAPLRRVPGHVSISDHAACECYGPWSPRLHR